MLENAVYMGVSPLDFWELTPFELFTMSKAFNEHRIEKHNQMVDMAFIGAYFERIEKLSAKETEQFKMSSEDIEKEQPQQTAKTMLDTIVELNKALGGTVY